MFGHHHGHRRRRREDIEYPGRALDGDHTRLRPPSSTKATIFPFIVAIGKVITTRAAKSYIDHYPRHALNWYQKWCTSSIFWKSATIRTDEGGRRSKDIYDRRNRQFRLTFGLRPSTQLDGEPQWGQPRWIGKDRRKTSHPRPIGGSAPGLLRLTTMFCFIRNDNSLR